MNANQPCPTCGFPLGKRSIEGLCPRCLRNQAIALENGVGARLGTEDPKDQDKMVAESSPLTQPIGTSSRIGRYRLVEKIGEGGFGDVYLAEQVEPIRRQVALKIIKLGMDTAQVVARFEAERQALALMDHPHIARVLDAGATDAGRPFFVMELVDGQPITHYCEEHRLSVEERLKLFILVCQAVQHAHQKGIIHRDLKPSNILVARPDPDASGSPKVIDFGIAKATQMELTEKMLFTQLNHFVGTPAYMSPEQLEMSGVDVDTRSDIYSLGVLLYELLTGSTPLDTTHLSHEQICRRIREEDPPKPSTRLKTLIAGNEKRAGDRRPIDFVALKKELRKDLECVVMKALDKDRTRRYETANNLALDVSHYLNNEPVLATGPSPIYRLRKLARRNRGTFTAVAIVVLALIGGAVLSTWQAIRATRSEREQSRLRREAQAQAYAADMMLAQQAYSEDNLGRTTELLDRHRPSTLSSDPTTSSDLRGWEWRYLWQQSRGEPHELLCQRPSGIFSISVSADGKWAAIGERLGGLTVWDMAAKTNIATLWESAFIIRTAFSPKSPLLAFAVVDEGLSTVFLWNGSTGKIVAEYALPGPCLGLSFSDDGSQLLLFAYAPADQVSILRIPEGTLLNSYSLANIELDWTGNLTAAAGNFTAAAHRFSANHIRVFDPGAGEERLTVSATETVITSMVFSPDGKLLAAGTGLDEGAIYLWNAQTGQRIAHWKAHRGYISRLKFWPDGKTLASAGADQLIGLWDLSDLPKVPGVRKLKGHARPVLDLALLPDNSTLASSSQDGAVYLWDTKKDAPTRTHLILTNTLVAWRFGPKSQSVVTMDISGKMMEWHGPEFQNRRILLDTERETGSATISDDLRRVATSTSGGHLQVWDVAQGRLPGSDSPIFQNAMPRTFLDQGQKLILHDFASSALREWDLAAGQEIASWPNEYGLGASGLLSPDERWLIRTPDSDTLMLTDRTTSLEMLLYPALSGLQATAFSSDGQYVAATSWRGFARVWETATGRELATLRGFMMGVHSAAFSPDGKRLATTSTGAEAVRLWDMESFRELLTLPAQNPTFTSTQFSPDGNLLGAMHYGAKLHIWRAPSWADVAADEE